MTNRSHEGLAQAPTPDSVNVLPCGLTKKAIRSALLPMSKALILGGPTQRIEFLGLKIECERLYNARGQIGFAWHPYSRRLTRTSIRQSAASFTAAISSP